MDADIEDIAPATDTTKPAALPVLDDDFKRSLHADLVAWYSISRRQMPWRGDPPGGSRSAYGTWVSEVMLQQTRVETVIAYWLRWMERFPDIQTLAAASPDEVNQVWAGLGYYRRAQHLLKGAQYVMQTHNGAVPSTVPELLLISGVGPYTAGAIASIAFNEKVAAVDGNVHRVFSRLFALQLEGKTLDKACWSLSGAVAAVSEDAGIYNQAVMELGATVCRPLSPACASCPMAAHCQAHAAGTVDKFPVKVKKSAPKEVSLAVLVLYTSEEVPRYLQVRRPSKGLLANQWEFPCLLDDEGSPPITVDDLRMHIHQLHPMGSACAEPIALPAPVVHVFSHERHTMRVTVQQVLQELPADVQEGVRWMSAQGMQDEGMTTGCKKILSAVLAMGKATVKGRKREHRAEDSAPVDAFALMKASSKAASKKQPRR